MAEKPTTLTPEQFKRLYGNSALPEEPEVLTSAQFFQRYGYHPPELKYPSVGLPVSAKPSSTRVGNQIIQPGAFSPILTDIPPERRVNPDFAKEGRVQSVEDLISGNVSPISGQRQLPPSAELQAAIDLAQQKANAEWEAEQARLDPLGEPWMRGLQQAAKQLGQVPTLLPNLMNLQPEFMRAPGHKKAVAELEAKTNKMADEVAKWAEREMPAKPARGKYATRPENFLDYLDPRRIYLVAGENVPLMGAFVASTIAHPVAGAALMFGVEGASAKETMRDWEKRTGKKIDPTLKNSVPIVVGAFNAALEKTGLDEIFKVGQAGGLKAKLLQSLIATMAEGTTEGAQEIIQMAGEAAYTGEISADAGQRLTESFYAGLVLGLGGSAISGGVTGADLEENWKSSAIRKEEQGSVGVIPRELQATQPPVPASSLPTTAAAQVPVPAPEPIAVAPEPIAVAPEPVAAIEEDGVTQARAALEEMVAKNAERPSPKKKVPHAKTPGRPKIPDATPETATGAQAVYNLSIASLKTDVDRFQNRDTDFSEKTAQEVAENFDPNKFDPIIVWRDPDDGKTYVLSGHSRLEGMKRRASPTIPARYFEGTEKEAMNFARVQANRLASAETFRETISAYKAAVESGYTQKQMKSTFGGDTSFLESASNLNQNGDFVNILNQEAREAFPYIKQFARWVGDARKIYGEKFTDRHEQQIFDWLYKGDENNKTTKRDEFFNMIDAQLQTLDFDPNRPLVLKRGEAPKTGVNARKDTMRTMQEVQALRARQQETITAQEYEAIQAQIDRKLEKVAEVVKTQQSLFDEITEAYPDLQIDLFGFIEPEKAPKKKKIAAAAPKSALPAQQVTPASEKPAVSAIGGDERRPAAPEAATSPKISETWQQTFDEATEGMQLVGKAYDAQRRLHEFSVAYALASGKPVPAKVLAEYPKIRETQSYKDRVNELARERRKADVSPETTPYPTQQQRQFRGLTRDETESALLELERNTQIRPGEAFIAMKITDAIADHWARWNNSTREEFYKQHIGAITSKDVLKNVKYERDAWRKAINEEKYGGVQPIVRGRFAIHQNTGLFVIQLFEQSNFSNLVHELGHLLRRVLPEQDQAEIRNWLDIKEDRKLDKSEEEKFARAWERYLLEGKAPSSAMQEIFERLKNILADIYRRITKIGLAEVEVNDDIRKVFDRIFATQEATPAKPSGREAIKDEIVRLARPKTPRFGPITEMEAEGGKWYSAFGVPFGAKMTGKTRVVGYAQISDSGGFIGLRYSSMEDAQRSWNEAQNKRDEEYRKSLANKSEAELNETLAFWRRKSGIVDAKAPTTKAKTPSPFEKKPTGGFTKADDVTQGGGKRPVDDLLPPEQASTKPREIIAFTERQFRETRNAVLPNAEQRAFGDTPYKQALLNALGGNVGLAKTALREIGEKLPENFIDTEAGRREARRIVSEFIARDEDVARVYAELVQAYQRGEVRTEAAPAPAEKPVNILQRAGQQIVDEKNLGRDIIATKINMPLPDGRILLAKNIASEKGAEFFKKNNPQATIVRYPLESGASRYAVVSPARVSTATIQKPVSTPSATQIPKSSASPVVEKSAPTQPEATTKPRAANLAFVPFEMVNNRGAVWADKKQRDWAGTSKLRQQVLRSVGGDVELADAFFTDLTKNAPDEWQKTFQKQQVVKGIIDRHVEEGEAEKIIEQLLAAARSWDSESRVAMVANKQSEQAPARQSEEASAMKPGTRELIDGLKAYVREIMAANENAPAAAQKKFYQPKLYELAEFYLGGTMADGVFDSSDAQDALEVAVNQIIVEDKPDIMRIPEQEALKFLLSLTRALPAQNLRTDEKTKFQQFSTPPAEAYAAVKLASPQAGEFALEPSAGTGSIAIFLRLAGCRVVANEISPRRVALLKAQGFETYSVDAQYLDDILPQEVGKPSLIVMNPPFSSTGGRLKNNRTEYGAQHVESALKRLKSGGRLVGIVGRGMGLLDHTFMSWWSEQFKKYNVRANVLVSGEEYAKYGTTFDNRIIIVDKTGPTVGENFTRQRDGVVSFEARTIGELFNASTKQFIDDRKGTAAQQANEANLGHTATVGAVGSSQGVNRGNVRQQTTVAPSSSGINRSGLRASDRTTGQPRPEKGAGSIQESQSTIQQPADQSAGQSRRLGSSGTEDVRSVNAINVTGSDVLNAAERVDESGIFTSYVPAKISIGKPHPANIVESGSMAAIEPPDIKYELSLPKALIAEGKVSSLQLETPIYAGMAFNENLPSGARRGFFNGDGTGVGKGRQIAATILDQWNKGARKILWVSASRDLIQDAQRDLNDIGASAIPLHLINDFESGEHIGIPQGIIFSTYSSLIAKSQAGKKLSRQEALEAWLKADESMIVFDEAHKAKNAVVSESGEPTQQGLAVVTIQENVPRARVLYASATGATDVRNMGYMTRLGLWGDGTAFQDFTQFLAEIDAGGVGAMEMVARDMKAAGQYLSRSISFAGVDYTEVIHEMTPEQRGIYNVAANAWQSIQQNIESALAATNANARARAFAISRFWSSHQRFFKSLLTALKVPSCIKVAQEALERGESVVIGIISTGESRTKELINQAVAEGADLDSIDFSPRAIMGHLIETAFPTELYQEVESDDGVKKSVKVTGPDGAPVQSREALEMKQALLDSLSDFSLPENPLDQIINYFGPENVAEMTGRKKRLIVNKRTGTTEYVSRASDDTAMNKVNISENKAFQDGRKKVAIISEAASTGISLHADNRAANKSRRVHITLELNWSADRQMQTFGRTHRTNQAQPPSYVLLSIDAGGEKRFSSTIASRMASLGALTKGQRDATGGGDLAKYNFETEEGKAATARIYSLAERNDPILGMENPFKALRDMGVFKTTKDGVGIPEDDRVNVTKFLNLILALDIERQNQMFDAFIGAFDEIVSKEKENGTFDDGITDLKAIRISEVSEQVVNEAPTGAKTNYVQIDVENYTGRLPFEEVLKNKELGFYTNKVSGHVYAVVPMRSITDQATGKEIRRYKLWNPKRRARIIVESELMASYSFKIQDDAEKLWEKEFETIPETEVERVHVISGAILPIWNKIKTQNLTKLRVTRAMTDKGKRIVGIIIPEESVGTILRALGVGRGFKSAQEIYHAVMKEGENIELTGGHELRKNKIPNQAWSGIEFTNAGTGDWKKLLNAGLTSVEHNYKKRFFLPLNEAKAVKALAELTKDYPPMLNEKKEDGADTLEDIELDGDIQNTLTNSLSLNSGQKTSTPEPSVEPGTQLTETLEDIQFENEDIERRWKASHGIKPPTFVEKLREFATTVWHQVTREYEHLPRTGEFAQLRADLQRLARQKPLATEKAVNELAALVDGLSNDDYQLFERVVVLNDLVNEADAGHPLPFGFNPESLQVEHRRLLARLASNTAVKDALRRRRAFWDGLKSSYTEAMENIGFDVESRFTKSDYYRHQVLMYANVKGKALTGTGARLKTPAGRGFLKQRQGSTYDINTNYVQAEFEVVSQMLYDIQVANTIAAVDKNYSIVGDLKEQAREAREETGDKSIRWQDFIPDGYVLWQPREGNVFYMSNSVPQRLAEELLSGALEKLEIQAADLIKTLTMGGPRRQFCVKAEVAATLDNMLNHPEINAFQKISRAILDKWKVWTLLSPRRLVKYSTRNFIGDADAMFAGSPSALAKVATATRLLMKAHRGEEMPREFVEWYQRGGMQVNLQISELGELDKLKQFDEYLATQAGGVKNISRLPVKAYEGYWKTVRLTTDMREAILRLAAYLDYLEQIGSNRDRRPNNFGASIPDEVLGVANPYDRAFKLSHELLGAYDQVSVFGQYVRAHIFPFWSFKEVNFRRYIRMMKNTAYSSESVAVLGRKLIGTAIKSPMVALRVGSFAIKATALMSVLQVWNHLFFGDEEDELPENVQSRPHIIFGRDAAGKIIYFDRLGSLGDFLEWFGLDDAPANISDFLLGRKTLREIASDMAFSPVNVVIQGIRPEIKLPAEIASRQSSFPDIRKMRTIRDRGLHIARSLGLGDEYTAIAGLPSRGYDHSLADIFVYRTDPGEAAYWSVFDMKTRYLKSVGRHREYGGGSGIDARSNALYNIKLALRYGDQEAVDKYLTEYATYGGTREGFSTAIRNLHPLAGLSTADKFGFQNSLNADDKERLRMAINFYDEVISEDATIESMRRRLPPQQRRSGRWTRQQQPQLQQPQR